MQEDAEKAINVIRSVKRTDLKSLRNKNKEILLSYKRVRLHEVSEYIRDVTLSEFKELLLVLKQKNVPLQVLRKIKNCCVSLEYIEAVFRTDGAVDSLIRILIGNDVQKQLEAAACLTNLACGSHKCSYKVAKSSGAYLVSFINGSNYFLQDQSAWAVANIANDCSECFNYIKAQGVLPALLKALQSPLPSVVESLVFALNACTKYEDPEIISLIQSGLPQRLLHFMEEYYFNRNIFLDAAFTLSSCCFMSIKYSLGTLDVDVVQQIICILMKITQCQELDSLAATPLIRCLGFLSCSDTVCKFLSVHTGFNESIQVILASEDSIHLKKEIIWVLSNITASKAVSSINTHLSPVFDGLKAILNADNSITLQVLYYLSSLASRDESIASLIKEHEIFSEIKCLLTNEQTDINQATRIFTEIVPS